MEFSSTYYYYLTNPTSKVFEEKAYNNPNQPNYIWKENTLYMRKMIWGSDFRRWLNDQGVDYDDSLAVYTPIAHIDNGVLTGYHTHISNISNRFLDMDKTIRERHYPNLYFVQIGNHPYPKEARYNQPWLVDQFHRECHRIIYPHHDPKQFFILPKDIILP